MTGAELVANGGRDVDYREPEAANAPDEATEERRLFKLIRKCDESEDATRVAREKSERDRDYYDNKQLTEAQHAALLARGQAPVTMNVIRPRVEWLQGLEKQERRDPKAYPRNNPEDVKAAEAFTDGMRYVIEDADYQTHRTDAWRNITIEGFGGIEMWVEPSKDGNADIRMTAIPWDRLIIDPHSTRRDFEDKGYVGQVMWLDLEDAAARIERLYGIPPAQSLPKLEYSLTRTTLGDTYEDKPKFKSWVDHSRKRVRLVQLWCKYPTGWWFHEFTLGGILAEGPSPYVDQETGETYCPIILDTAFVDRDNNRYGAIRDLIDPQDEINKRRSKALSLLNSKGVIATHGVVKDRAQAKKQLAKPDPWIELDAEAMKNGGRFEIIEGAELAQGQVALGEQALRYVQQTGPNAALLGKGTEDQSGKAIEAQQQGGMMELGDLRDTLRRLDRRVFRMIAMMMKQWWTAIKWVRVTDDELTPRFVGFNVPVYAMIKNPMTGQETPAIDPRTGQPILRGVQNNIGELDLDIIISDAPSVMSLDNEDYKALVELIKGLDPRDPRTAMVVELHPSLTPKRKAQMIDILKKMSEPQQKPPEVLEAEEMAKDFQHARTGEMRSRAFKNAALAEAALGRVNNPFLQPPQAPVSAV